jgi:hypothetical protein
MPFLFWLLSMNAHAAIDFEVDGTPDSLSLPANMTSLQNVSSATLMVWIRPESIGSFMQIFAFSTGTSSTSTRAGLAIQTTGAFRVAGRRTDAEANNVNQSGTAVAGTLYHMAANYLYSTGSLDLYVDGALLASVAIAGWTANSSNTVSLGTSFAQALDGSTEVDGILDDMRVYSPALTANQINTIYRAKGADKIVTGLLHRWTMGELSSGSTVSGANSVKDKGSLQVHASPVTVPVYVNEIAKHRSNRR